MTAREDGRRRQDDVRPEERGPALPAREDGRRRQNEVTPEELGGIFYQASTNQRQDEPLPASHDDDNWQEAVRRNAEHARGAARQPASPARRGRAVRTLSPSDAEPGPTEPGAQVAAGEGADGRVSRVRRVARAAPGRPEGEVNPGQ